MKDKMKMTAGNVMMAESNNHCYPKFLDSVKNRFNKLAETQFFTTNGTSLFTIFIENLPLADRQEYTCRTCKRFIEHYGNLVLITEHGETKSAIWDEDMVPNFFRKSVAAMRKVVEGADISGVFISGTKTLGNPLTDGWSHLSVTLPETAVITSKLKTPDQMATEKKEEFRILTVGLAEYSLDTVNQAVTILKADALYRSETCLGVAEWLRKVHIRYNSVNNRKHKTNIIWAESAAAPVGYCHIRSSMIGTLLDDIREGMEFHSIKKRFAEKMNPIKYQRPQALPTAGNIQAAEKIVEKLGIQPSLERRFARIEELNLMWNPTNSHNKTAKTGLFSHLQTKQKALHTVTTPAVTMTWRKFSEEVLPEAKKIEYLVQEPKTTYSAIVTAVNEDAPPILQWDHETRRNPFSWYVYHGGSHYRQWNLTAGYCEVTGICLQPSMWYGNHPHRGKSVFLILSGAKDKSASSSCLFPELLKSELHAVRSTIEAYSKSTNLKGQKEATACGLKLESSSTWNITLRVTTETGTMQYKLDRWD